MESLAERQADRARRKAEAEAERAATPSPIANPSPHETARAKATGELGYDPYALAGIGRYDPNAVKVPN